MANNTTLNTMSGGDVIATLDISGTKYARGVTGFLAPGGTSVTDVSAASPLPITVASLPLPSGAASETTLAILSGKVPALGQAVAGSSLPVVLPSAQITTLTPPAAITGFSLETTQSTVSGSLLTISGKLPTALTGSGNLKVSVAEATATQSVAGDIAGGATDSGNPVKVAGRVNTTPPTYTDGQRGELQVDSRGNLRVSIIASGNTSTLSIVTTADAQASAAGAVANSRLQTYNGATWDMARGTVANGLLTDVSRIAAGTNVIGVTIAPVQTGAVYSGTTALTPKFAVIAASSSGNTSAVALVSAKKIRVLKLTLSASAAVNVKFQSNTTDICGLIYCAASSGMGMGYCPVGHFETVAGETLNINLSAAVPVGGVLTYVEV